MQTVEENVKFKPNVIYKQAPSGSHILRFPSLNDIYWFDSRKNNPKGLGFGEGANYVDKYKIERNILTKPKIALIEKAQKAVSQSDEFNDIIYKAKSQKREIVYNKFCGNLDMVRYSRGEDKMFMKGHPGAKKSVVDMAFQVGTFVNGDYEDSFVNILKTILMFQAMGISLNIDVFDSEKHGFRTGTSPKNSNKVEYQEDEDNNDDPSFNYGYERAYTIVNVANSAEKLNMKNILAFSHEQFFDYTLFNAYSATGREGEIYQFLNEKQILKDLAPMYDLIGGNMIDDSIDELTYNENHENIGMIKKLIKIAWGK